MFASVLAMLGRRSARRVRRSGAPPLGVNIAASEMEREKALVFVEMSNWLLC